ncbi:AMP-binding protein [Limnoglobus roseus]|uniref:Acylglycerophosphoethanolamine acyltransferase n=1 Tax=Limnoglobus roseus TaxID=2598579 RepID=A0A5C1AB27_9BACT|nr:AMP-binding protein [Limnoglobus roseus]QEL15226.1 acylglycerophosphoethanolamine acyltransferase [Limnoglobus roseus]
MNLVRILFSYLVQFVLGLRYRVRVGGTADAIKQPGPYLILPSHPAYMDPPNVIAHLWRTFRMRPMLLETNFESPILAPLAWLLRAIKVPETEKASAEARQRAAQSVQEVITALKAGDNVVLWPSGTLSRNGKDSLGAARTAADVLKAVPEATLVLVRTRGLWGSSFSWAYAKKPRLVPMLFRGIRQLFANLILFSPRRRVAMRLESFAAKDRPEPTREKLNPWLEAWYNADGGEQPTFVPYHFLFGPRTIEFPPPVQGADLDVSKVKPQTIEMVKEIVEQQLKRPLTPEENKAETTFAQLGLDSLEGMEIALQVEQRSGFSSDLVPTGLGQLWALADGLLDSGPPKPAPKEWFAPPSDTRPLEILGETVAEAFVNRVGANRREIAAADDLAGAVTYEKLFVGATAMAARFRDLPGDNVGLLLPASVAADLAFLGLHLANKLPVALNWTTGPANLEHAAKLMKLSRVVTSKKFIDRTQIEVPGTQFVFLEDVRATMGKFELLRRLLGLRFLSGFAKRKALGGVNTDPQRPAVVLFTSGSEKAPKAVPLTHANIIADMRGATPPQELTRADSVLGFLPMFHSFGLTIAGLFPLLAGAKVVHHPDPTDASSLARKAAAYKPTIIISTPTFVGFILNRCKPGDLDSLRLIVVGAEKCPDDIFRRVKELAPHASVLEGYGVTECAPCVAVNPVSKVKHGTIGKPLPNVTVCVVDLESGEKLPPNKMGLLLVSGPTVFPGYIGYEGESPFRDLDGVRWYVTGDLAALDDDGYIVFHGRLKRFLKAGGEMISLPALEEPLARMFPATDDGPRVAVEGIERDGGRLIVLFTTEEIALRDANAALQKEGFRGVMRLDEVRKVDAIPVLGTGKTDYKVLRAKLTEAKP